MSASPSKYNTLQVSLHWLVALMAIMALGMGTFVLAETPNSDPGKVDALRSHMIVGGALFILTLVRIVWRKFSAQPNHLDSGNALRDKLGVAAHYVLNLLVLLIAISGIALSQQAGLPDIVFDGIGTLPTDFSTYTPRIAHGILTKVLAALVVLHLLAALYHQFGLKDGIFRRMWFGKS